MSDEKAPASYLEPPWVVRKVVNPLLMLFGMATTLAVRGRTSGEWRTVPVNVLEHDGERYLVAPRGATQWVKNLRAAGGGELRRRGNVEPFSAVEIAVDERPPLIAAYRERWDREVKKQFEALPDPDDHPVFLIRSTPAG